MADDEKQGVTRDEFRNYIDKLDTSKTENERLLARNTLIISGGAFTLSITWGVILPYWKSLSISAELDESLGKLSGCNSVPR